MILRYFVGLFWLCTITFLIIIKPINTNAQIHEIKLVISEVMWMGSDLSTADEWIEFVNASSGTLNISGWRIDYLKSGSIVTMFEFPQGTKVESGQYFVVSNYNSENSRLDINPDFVDSKLSLPNSKLHLWLIDSNGNILDEVDDGVGVPFAGNNLSGTGAKASMERIDILAVGSDKLNWRSSKQSIGFDDGVKIYGTPGFPVSSDQQDLYLGAGNITSDSTTGSLSSDLENSDFPVGIISSGSGDISSGTGGLSLDENASSSGSGNTSPVDTSTADILPRVLISEIFANPKGKDDNEWIEIINYENYPIDISGWEIRRGSEKYIFEDYVIKPDGIFVMNKSETDLTLKNSGDTLELFSGSLLIDSFTYPEVGEEMSYGRKGDDPSSFAMYCVSTKGEKNRVKKLYPRIVVQSGHKRAEDKVTINFDMSIDHGSINSASCTWDFDDGIQSFKCNPPSHTWNEVGVYAVTLSLETACGTFEEVTEYVEVLEKIQDVVDVQRTISNEVKEPESPVQGYFPALECIPTISSGVTIIEVYPSPNKGEEEWIKLKNNLDHEFNLCGWILDDIQEGGSKPWTISNKYQIPPKGELKLMQSETRLALNNSGDEIWLISPNRETKISVKYPNVKKGQLYVFNTLESSTQEKANPPVKSVLQTEELVSFLPNEYEQSISKQRFVSLKHESDEKTTAKHDLPLPKKYKNILPASYSASDIKTSKTESGENLSGVFLNMKIWENDEQILRDLPKQSATPKQMDIILIISGIFSSLGIFALKIFRG